MRRDAGRHPDGNAFWPVDKQVGDFHRQYGRLLFVFIKIRDKIHHVFIQIRQKRFLCYFFQPRFRITHCRCAVPFDIPEISMAIHQRHAFFKFLCHHHQCIIYGTVSMGMVFSHSVAHDTGTLPVRPVITDTQFIHIV